MPILFHPESRTFHLKNSYYSYLMKILPDGNSGTALFRRPFDRSGGL